MKNLSWLLLFLFFGNECLSQATLPNITATNVGGKIIISWKNNYTQPISNISIQRSFDTLKNYTTIGSVLNPQNTENGFADNKPPYNKMYYRVFVAFEGGKYEFSNIIRPIKIKASNNTESSPAKDSNFIYETNEPVLYRDSAGIKVIVNKPKIGIGKILPKSNLPEIINPKIITYPSKRIFTAKTNAVVIDLPDADVKKYTVKFYTENDEPIFELKDLPSKYIIIEKVNFERSGWYNFEIYENGILIEKNKFFVPKDVKNNR